MANIGTGPIGQTVIGQGTGVSPTFAAIGTGSGLTANSLILAQGLGAFTNVLSVSNSVLISNAGGVPTFLPNGTTGQILTATTGSPPSWASPAVSSLTFDGDVGAATTSGGIITFNANTNAGSSIVFSAASHTVSLLTTDSNSNTMLGSSSGNVSISGSFNSGFGSGALHALTTTSNNCAFGASALTSMTSGSANTAFGESALGSILTGTNCIGVGHNAGASYVGSESHNICLNNAGTAAESNVLRIGSGTGTSTQQLSKAFISGINGVTTSNTVIVTTNSSTDQLGVVTAVGTANGGTGLTATPGNNTLLATNSSGTLSYRAFSVNVQVFTSGTGTYTPSTGMLYCTIEVIGGGGGGGGAGSSGAASVAVGGGGGGGGYARKIFSAATIGASKTYAVGAGGTAGTSGNTTGGTGGTTSVGSTIISATGGTGGSFETGAVIFSIGTPGTGGSGASGDFNCVGGAGGSGFGAFNAASSPASSGQGGNSVLGGGAPPAVNITTASPLNGIDGNNYGGGGSGGANSSNSGSGSTGGAGAGGLIIITEYIIN